MSFIAGCNQAWPIRRRPPFLSLLHEWRRCVTTLSCSRAVCSEYLTTFSPSISWMFWRCIKWWWLQLFVFIENSPPCQIEVVGRDVVQWWSACLAPSDFSHFLDHQGNNRSIKERFGIIFIFSKMDFIYIESGLQLYNHCNLKRILDLMPTIWNDTLSELKFFEWVWLWFLKNHRCLWWIDTESCYLICVIWLLNRQDPACLCLYVDTELSGLKFLSWENLPFAFFTIFLSFL